MGEERTCIHGIVESIDCSECDEMPHNRNPVSAELTTLRAENEKLGRRIGACRKENQRLKDEHYSDLLGQMEEAWGRNYREITGEELRAFLDSRVVHKPHTNLTARCERFRKALENSDAYLGEWEDRKITASQACAGIAANIRKSLEEE